MNFDRRIIKAIIKCIQDNFNLITNVSVSESQSELFIWPPSYSTSTNKPMSLNKET